MTGTLTDQTVEITKSTAGWQEMIARHVAAGDVVEVRIETPSLSPADAAQSLNVSRSAVQKWITQGKITAYRRGAYYRIPKAEVERFRAARIKSIIDDSYDEIVSDLFGQ